MPIIVQAANYQPLGQVVPGLKVVINTPQVQLTGAESDILGLVGVASWGPLNTPMVFSGTSDGSKLFGNPTVRSGDLMTAVGVAALQGVESFIGVRVSDGTDVAASTAISSIYTLTTKNTGVLGNTFTAVLSLNSNNTTKLVVSSATLGVSETIDQIPYTGTGTTDAPIFVARVNAASKYIVASIIGNLSSPSSGTFTFSGGKDGGVPASSAFIGVDGNTRTGIYALRGQGCQVVNLVDFSDLTQVSTLNAFGLGEGMYMVMNGPAGQSVQSLAGLTGGGWAVKVMFGDWLYYQDNVNQTTRLLGPASFVAGTITSLAPNDTSLNKQIIGVIGSQRAGQASTAASATYSFAEKTAIINAGYDLVANPSPGGYFWSAVSGTNTATGGFDVRADSYTRMTNFLARSIAGSNGAGQFIGSPITSGLFKKIASALRNLLRGAFDAGYLDSAYAPANGLPYAVLCDQSNNPQEQVAQGYVQAQVQVIYEGQLRNLDVQLTGGASVQVTVT